MYKSEKTLVSQFVRGLQTTQGPWGTVEISREFYYQRGRPDVLALAENGNHLIAFEAKLQNWRDALHQAYRNTCFAHSSYVVVPRQVAVAAQQFKGEFMLRNVGLCYVDNGIIAIIFDPERRAPLEPWLLNAALAEIRKKHARR